MKSITVNHSRQLWHCAARIPLDPREVQSALAQVFSERAPEQTWFRGDPLAVASHVLACTPTDELTMAVFVRAFDNETPSEVGVIVSILGQSPFMSAWRDGEFIVAFSFYPSVLQSRWSNVQI